MKTHLAIVIIFTISAVAILIFAPLWNVGIGFGLLLLICPLMMIGMMLMMHDKHK